MSSAYAMIFLVKFTMILFKKIIHSNAGNITSLFEVSLMDDGPYLTSFSHFRGNSASFFVNFIFILLIVVFKKVLLYFY